MKSMADHARDRILIGRTYIETLILTLTQFEFLQPDPDLMIRIAERLEIEVCALSTIMNSVKTYYANSLKQLIKEVFGKDISLPTDMFNKCMIVESLMNYLISNPDIVFDTRLTTTDASNKIKNMVARIAISAIHSAFYQSKLIRIEV